MPFLCYKVVYCVTYLLSKNQSEFKQNTIMELVPCFENSFILCQSSILSHYHYTQPNRKNSLMSINMQTKQHNKIIIH